MRLFVPIFLTFINYDNSGIWVYIFLSNLRILLMEGTFESIVQVPSFTKKETRQV